MPGTVEVRTPDGRILVAHATSPSSSDVATLVWHHGSPHTGAQLAPVVDAACARGLRVVTYARPGYGGSPRTPGRDVASAADDVAATLETLGIARDTPVVTMGASGGGPHALACAALLGDEGGFQVRAAATFAGLAPFDGTDEWFGGMRSDQALRAAARGVAAREAYALTEEWDPQVFTTADWAALEGPWRALGEDAGRASETDDGGLVDDDVAFVSPWGFAPTTVQVPVLLVHGSLDRIVPAAHTDRLARVLSDREVWVRPEDGHVSVLGALPDALDWLLAQAGKPRQG